MIRSYRPEDLDALVGIGNRAWQPIYEMFRETYGEALFEAMVPDPSRVKGEQVRRHCEAHPDRVLVCEEGGRIVGFLTFHLDEERKIGEIGNNARDPECDAKGVGQQMYAAVLDLFRERGMRFAKVMTGLDEAHASARRAYERAGFDIRHEDVKYFMRL